jgi:hypothetical protein
MPEDQSWQLAISLVAAWRETGSERGYRAVARRLAELTAEGDGPAERAVLGLIALSNMFAELYADCAGKPVDTVLQDAAAIRWDGGSTN